MMSTRITPSVRGVTWLLAVAFLFASLPAPAFAQDMAPPPADARARDRIAQFQFIGGGADQRIGLAIGQADRARGQAADPGNPPKAEQHDRGGQPDH